MSVGDPPNLRPKGCMTLVWTWSVYYISGT